MTGPRIYVADLAAYNDGRLVGRWIDACQDADDIADDIAVMLEPNAEEWAIHDFEGFEGWKPGESEPLFNVACMAAGIAEHGAAFAVFAANYGEVPSVEEFEESYRGEWDSLADYAQEFAEDIYDTKELGALAAYIDWQRFGRDMVYGGDVWTADTGTGSVYVFQAT